MTGRKKEKKGERERKGIDDELSEENDGERERERERNIRNRER